MQIAGPRNRVGPPGKDGLNGKDGSQWIVGNSEPTEASNPGDMFINASTGDIYQFNTEWTFIGNIKGPKGKDGRPGKDGKDGKNGSSGGVILQTNTGSSSGGDGMPAFTGSIPAGQTVTVYTNSVSIFRSAKFFCDFRGSTKAKYLELQAHTLNGALIHSTSAKLGNLNIQVLAIISGADILVSVTNNELFSISYSIKAIEL